MTRERKLSAYQEKLLDPRWQRKRLEIMSRDEFACQACFDAESTLHVHHRYYVAGNEPWDYPAEALVTLCEFCHEGERAKWPLVEQTLLRALKRRFFASEALAIAVGFDLLDLPHMSDVVAEAITKTLADPKKIHRLVGEYLDALGKERRAE